MCLKYVMMFPEFLRILSLAQKYLYDPNSPYRDEDIYGRLAAHCGGDLAAEARLCALNERGGVAADFVYEDARGRRHTLHGTEAPFTVLFFSNPGCTACKEIIDNLPGVMERLGIHDLTEIIGGAH